jgi:hypothetical protein
MDEILAELRRALVGAETLKETRAALLRAYTLLVRRGDDPPYDYVLLRDLDASSISPSAATGFHPRAIYVLRGKMTAGYIFAIKHVRERDDLSLKDAKEYIDALPVVRVGAYAVR